MTETQAPSAVLPLPHRPRRLPWERAGIYMLGVVVALAIAGIAITLVGGDVRSAYATVLRVSLGSVVGVGQTLNKMTPLLLATLAVVLSFSGGYFNIGVDGQIYLGAIFATGSAFALGALGLPRVVLIPAVLLAGIAGGALYAFIPAVLRAVFAVNEIFVTVMLNFVALFLTEYLATGPWNDPLAGEAITRPIPAAATLPMLIPRAGTHAGILIALGAVVVVAWLLARTVLGYQIRAVGDNPRAARIGGVPITVVTLVALTASGALAGLAGAVEVSGFHYRLILGLTPGYGIMAILIAVLARQHPVGAAVAAFFFAVLLVGSDSLQRSVGLPASAVFVFQAVIVLTVLLAEALRKR
ncbi:MAG TPA: ABC transporter permease [bacterium]|nr:ABC transporter permease [bacterium]